MSWLLVSTAAAVCAAPVAAQSIVASAPFEAGIAAYRAGDYRQARDRFREAEVQGRSSEELRFNLALAHYKLGEYDAARAAFESLRSSAGLGAIAEYHLGLVAAQRGRKEQAAAHLLATQAMTDSTELRQLADVALQRLANEPQRFGVFTAFGAGYDSNRTQSSETARTADVDPHAEFTELSTVARYFIGRDLGTELRGSFYARDYAPDQELDQYSAQLSLRRSWPLGVVQLGAATETEAVWLAGESFQNAAGVNLDASWTRGASTFSARYRPSVIAGGEDYQYVDGWSQRGELAYSYVTPGLRLRLNYEAEVNDRRDLERGEEFFSQSPVRHGLGVRLNHRLTSMFSLDWSAGFRHSRYRDSNRYASETFFVATPGVDRPRFYRDPNRYVSTFTILEGRRVDELAHVGVAGVLKMSRNFGLRLDYRFSDNVSRLDRYDYERHAVLLGLDWSP